MLLRIFVSAFICMFGIVTGDKKIEVDGKSGVMDKKPQIASPISFNATEELADKCAGV